MKSLVIKGLGLWLLLIFSLAASLQSEDPVIKKNSAANQHLCDDWTKFKQEQFEIHNNVWGKEKITNYKQCIFSFAKPNSGQIRGFGWDWNWPIVNDNVKAYPSILFGRKPWHNYSTSPQLPLRIADISRLQVSFDLESQASGAYNLLLESWIIRDKFATSSDRTGELAIHLYQHNVPGHAGKFIASVNLSGYNFDFYLEPKMTVPEDNHTWVYYGFIHTGKPIQHAAINMGQFIEYLVEHNYVNAQHYIASIELGNEIYDGQGKTQINSFAVEARSNN